MCAQGKVLCEVDSSAVIDSPVFCDGEKFQYSWNSTRATLPQGLWGSTSGMGGAVSGGKGG